MLIRILLLKHIGVTEEMTVSALRKHGWFRREIELSKTFRESY